MKVFVIFVIAVPSLSLQNHRHEYESCSGELDLSRQDYDYGHSPIHYRAAPRKHKHKKHSSKSKSSAEREASNNKFAARHDRRSHRHSERSSRYSDNCVCDCQKCEDLQQCCQPVCNNECDDADQNQVDAQPGLSPGNLVFVPYPYPLVVPPPPPPVLPVLAGVGPGPGPGSVTTSTAPSIERLSNQGKKDNLLELLHNMKYRQETPYGRDHVVMRPMKRNIPDYDIPISNDHLLDRLLSQVRNVKDINSA